MRHTRLIKYEFNGLLSSEVMKAVYTLGYSLIDFQLGSCFFLIQHCGRDVSLVLHSLETPLRVYLFMLL